MSNVLKWSAGVIMIDNSCLSVITAIQKDEKWLRLFL